MSQEKEAVSLASGMTVAEILDDFPYLTEEDIRACLQYAADREKRVMVAQKLQRQTR